MKKIMKFILGFVAAAFIIIVVLWGSFVYVSDYKITRVDTSASPDGTHELVLQAVGEADFPFGSASGRLILYEDKNRISKADFELLDDGGCIRGSIWKVTWYEDYVKVILSGDEQPDEQIILYFDGKKETKQLTDTIRPEQTDVADETEQINPESHRELSLVGVVDDYVSAEELSDFFASQDSLEKMVSFNQILNNQFEFYEIYNQPLQAKFYWDMDDGFLETYDGAPIKNQEIEIEGEKCFISTLNSIEVNLNAYQYFLDFIGEGRGFCESDFQYKRNEKIPVILGNDYKSYYFVGDCINLNYLGKDFEYEIIGFFEEGLNVKIENSEYNINKYLCVPYFEFDGNVTDESEKVFWLRHYQEKNYGYIKVDNINGLSEEEIIEFYGSEVQKIAEELEIKYNVLAIIYHISTEKDKSDSIENGNKDNAAETYEETDMYNHILEEYRDMVQNDFYIDLLGSDNYDSSFGEDIGSEIRTSKKAVFYAFYDIDGNGTKELLIAGGEDGIGVSNPAFSPCNYDIYGYDGTNVFHIFPEMEFGYRTDFSIYENGIIGVYYSYSAAESGVDFYRIGSDGFTPELVDFFSAVWHLEGEESVYTYFQKENEISEEEYKTKVQSYAVTLTEGLDWIEIY